MKKTQEEPAGAKSSTFGHLVEVRGWCVDIFRKKVFLFMLSHVSVVNSDQGTLNEETGSRTLKVRSHTPECVRLILGRVRTGLSFLEA